MRNCRIFRFIFPRSKTFRSVMAPTDDACLCSHVPRCGSDHSGIQESVALLLLTHRLRSIQGH